MSETPKRRWLLIAIREAVLSILALGFALAWYNERNAWAPVRNCVDSVRRMRRTQDLMAVKPTARLVVFL